MKLFIKLAMLALLIYWMPKFVHGKTDGFVIANIQSNLPSHPRFEVEGLP